MNEDASKASNGSRISSRARRSSAQNSRASKLADVRPGEGRSVVIAALVLFGIVAAHIAMETARDAIFLTRLGPDYLSYVYMAMAALAALVGRFEFVVERALGRTNALILSLMMVAMGTTLFYVSDKSDSLAFALYLWTGLSGTLLLLQFWLFASTRFDAAQGKRLYGLIAAGGVLGAVFGGGLSSLFTRYIDVETLLALAASIHLLTALLITGAPPTTIAPEAGKTLSLSQSLRSLSQNPYVIRIVGLTAIATFTLLVTDYLFKLVATENVPEAELGQFLAVYYMLMNGAALVIQIFISVKVLQRAGTIFTLTLLPLSLLLASGAPLLIGAGVVAAALLAKGADGALRHSLHKVSMELLFLPLRNSERSSAKGFVDAVVVRGAQGVTALFLLGLTAIGWGRPRLLFTLVLGGSAIWVLVALSLKKPYLNQFRQSIGRNPGRDNLHLNQLTLDSVEVVIESLSDPDENRALSAMSLFESAGRTRLIPALLLYRPEEPVILRALDLIPSHDRKDWISLAERLVEHESEDVRLAAVRALGRYGYLEKLDPESLKHPRIAATAAFFLADRSAAPGENPHISVLLTPLADTGAQAALLSAIAEYGSPRWGDVLLRLAVIHAPEFAQLLPRAMVRARDPRFIPELIERLSDRKGAREARAALKAIGHQAFDALKAQFINSKTPSTIRSRIPRAIAEFGNQNAADFLVECLHRELPGAARYKSLRALGTILKTQKVHFQRHRILPLVLDNALESLRNNLLANELEGDIDAQPSYAQSSGHLLVQLLRDKQDQSTERVTRLLQLLHPRENLRRVYLTLKSGDRTARSAASELIEVITLGYDEDLRAALRTLSDPSPEKTDLIAQTLGTSVHTSTEALREILVDPDPPLSAIAADYAQKCGRLELSVEVQQVLAQNGWLAPRAERVDSVPPKEQGP